MSLTKSIRIHPVDNLTQLKFSGVYYLFLSDTDCFHPLRYTSDTVKDVRLDIDGEKPFQEKLTKKRTLQKWKSFPSNVHNSNRGTPRSKKWTRDIYADVLQIDDNPLPKPTEEEEAVGIITMEDVIEELLQVLKQFQVTSTFSFFIFEMKNNLYILGAFAYFILNPANIWLRGLCQ